ncbi:MAG: hypothetical protein IT372_40800 [Polyangiaceae bacterium]|nr:hypothetical protein [Polyangiaceae bacterium]
MKIEVVAWSVPARYAALALQALAVVNLVYLAVALVNDILEGTESAPPLIVAAGLVLFSAIPLLLAALLRRLHRGALEVEPPRLSLTLRRARFEIPAESVTGARAARWPFPDAVVALVLKSGRRFRYRLASAAPGDLLTALGEALPSAQALAGHGSIAYAAARRELGRRGRAFWAVKYGLAPLALNVVAFRLHQLIVFGGPFGQYRAHGLGPYLRTFAEFWVGIAGGLVVYAASVRIAAEVVALPLTWALPLRARGIRKTVEIVCLVAYFVLVPAFVASRLLG